MAATSAATTLAVAGFVLPYVLDGGRPDTVPRPAASPVSDATTETAGSDGPDRAPAPNARELSAASPAAQATPSTGAHDRSLLPLSVPPLPEASLSSVPAVPEVPSVSNLPSVPGLPGLRDASTVPTTLPAVPEASGTPSVPVVVPTPTALP